MRIIASIGGDPVGVRRIDGQLDDHPVWIGDVKRRAIAMLEDKAVGLLVACGCEPLLDLVLCLGIAFERDVMKRGGGQLRTEEYLILGFFKLEEGQRAAVADPEETMTIGSHRAEELVRLAPSGNQRKAQQVLLKSSCRLEVLAYISGVMEPAWDFAVNAHCPLSVRLLRRPSGPSAGGAMVTH